MARLRIFSQVIEHKPITFEPYPHQPMYHCTYWQETLACGHVHTSFEAHASKRRECKKCEEAFERKAA